ncbi:Gp138 family membrane-puncturing spike protein [Acetobacter sp. UBA5411]|uniref:Gp138 family membrane-puncturing spike protein n=1 Tax=Acetobacter sp. UBA5411 TaxID=1945905 RepID=UPI0025C0F0B2|nr:Gp138 family membrane-puncturing spike protein [Acetobacter sp. UBA5411]
MADRLFGTLSQTDSGSGFTAINAQINRIMSLMGSNMPVKVLSVSATGLEPVGFVDVQILVHQVDGRGNPTERGILHNVPYIRIQGGTRAIICDPAAGDIGFIMIAGRDISNVKANRAAAVPGSFRVNDWADAVYIGGLLNAAPEEYIGWIDGNIHVKTAGQFIVDAASMQVNCGITATGDVKAGNISLESHTHTENGKGSQTSAPE